MTIIFEASDKRKIAFTNNRQTFEELSIDSKISLTMLLGSFELGMPETDIKDSQTTQQNGVIIDNIKYTKRILEFDTDFLANNPLEISNKRRELASILNPQQPLGRLIFYVDDNLKSTQNKYYLNEIVSKVMYPSKSGGRTSHRQAVELEFTAFKPLFNGEPQTLTIFNKFGGNGRIYPFVYPFTYNPKILKPSQIVNDGDIDIDFIAEFEGLLNSAELISQNQNKKIAFKDNVDIPISDAVISNTELRTTTINGINAFDKLKQETRYFKLTKGENNIIFNAGNDNQTNQVKITYINKYISI